MTPQAPAAVASTAKATVNETLSPPSGMTLRDWFAAQAMSGLISAPSRPGVYAADADGTAKAAYEYANAMLKQRER